MSFLDVGCGPGALTAKVGKLGIDAMGVDRDSGFVRAARESHPEVRFEALDVAELSKLGQRYDIVYARYLLSHLSDPEAAVRVMMSATRPGGRVVLEDIDFDLHVAEPRPAAFDRYLELYEAVVRRRGGDPFLGRRLFGLSQRAGLQRVQAAVQVSVFTQGEEKRISSLTLSGIRESLVAEELATGAEIDGVLEELAELEADPHSLVSVAGTHQVWGRVG
jgi:SAM-dependent methyltransferase